MKKIIIYFMAFIMVLALTSCVTDGYVVVTPYTPGPGYYYVPTPPPPHHRPPHHHPQPRPKPQPRPHSGNVKPSPRPKPGPRQTTRPSGSGQSRPTNSSRR